MHWARHHVEGTCSRSGDGVVLSVVGCKEDNGHQQECGEHAMGAMGAGNP
jgi:hypothetical protein